MTVRPSPPMRNFEVSAILREVAEPGSGKSQFRRVLKPQPYVARHCTVCGLGMGEWSACEEPDCGDLGPGVPIVKTLPFAIGDLLWCRETWQHARQRYCSCPQGSEPCPCDDWSNGEGCRSNRGDVIYRADGESIIRWRSSTQMPRWASRLTLEVVGVKIERVQEISEDDARAEGAKGNASGPWGCEGLIEDYSDLWDRVHGPGSWDANPWVAAVTFRPHLANVDDLLRQREGGR